MVHFNTLRDDKIHIFGQYNMTFYKICRESTRINNNHKKRSRKISKEKREREKEKETHARQTPNKFQMIEEYEMEWKFKMRDRKWGAHTHCIRATLLCAHRLRGMNGWDR